MNGFVELYLKASDVEKKRPLNYVCVKGIELEAGTNQTFINSLNVYELHLSA